MVREDGEGVDGSRLHPPLTTISSTLLQPDKKCVLCLNHEEREREVSPHLQLNMSLLLLPPGVQEVESKMVQQDWWMS